MLALKMVVRVLGVTWVAGLATAAWHYTPSSDALAAPNAKPASALVSDVAAASTAGPVGAARVVYQGAIMGSATPQRTVQPSLPATAQTSSATLVRERVGQQDTTSPAQAVRAVAPAVPTKVARLDEPTAASVAPPLPRRVDLNAASVADLNGLGGGMIGRAIIAGRPYRSPEDLLAKRVLNKATFARIKDQIAAQ